MNPEQTAPSIFFVPTAFSSVAYIFKCTSDQANTVSPDQTAPKEQSDLCPYCFHYRLPTNQ